DSSTAQEIIDLLIQLNKEKGLTFVLVTHDSGVGRQCNRLIRMRDGEITGDTTNRDEIDEMALGVHI
ncbi:MAG: ABC transporter ATP-binding protein, partial [Thermomicrobiales bacterium]